MLILTLLKWAFLEYSSLKALNSFYPGKLGHGLLGGGIQVFVETCRHIKYTLANKGCCFDFLYLAYVVQVRLSV